ncbi:hypothetical protein ACJJTC_005861 [Scirpophaga incertulas]
MGSKILLLFFVAITIATANPAGWSGWPQIGMNSWAAGNTNPWAPSGGVSPWIPTWVASAPWYPQWSPCTAIGSTCLDCTTKQICTKVGGIQRACTDPTLPYCNLGECSATPSAECQPSTSQPTQNA